MDHRYIKFLDYVVTQKGSFHLEPALTQANMSESEFELIRDTIFYRENLPDLIAVRSQVLNWTLRPEALFGYLTYIQYDHAVKSSTRAFFLASAFFAVAIIGVVLNLLVTT